MYPFPSINQFRNVVQKVRHQAAYMGQDEAGESIYNPAPKYPTLSFIGTVKLHGTNAAIVFGPEGITFQSRERVLKLTEDNAGFMNHMVQFPGALAKLRDQVETHCGLVPNGPDTTIVYGEWCGGNIQKGVAISGLPKMFVVFAVKVNGAWVPEPDMRAPEASIYDINQFAKYFVSIDFEKPEISQNHLANLTKHVETCCPVGKVLGHEGIGEGIVWRCVEDPSSDFWFKVKGEKHSASKVKTLASVDVEAITKMRDFVASTVTESRLEQGLQNLRNEQLKPFDMTSMGDFIRWVHADVLKEEADTLEASGLNPKSLGGPLAQVCRAWYVNRLNTEVLQTS